MKLYSRPLSPYSARARVALYAKAVPFEHVVVEMGWSKDPVFLAKNALGRIPVLELDDGTCLIESAAIVEYLDEAYPERPLRLGTPLANAKLRALVVVAEHDVLAPMMQYFVAVDGKTDVTAVRTKLETGMRHVERMLEHASLFHVGGHVTLADAILLPVRHSLQSLVTFANEPTLLDSYPHLRSYGETARTVEPLARVWREMDEGLFAFAAWRAKEQAAM